MDSTVLIISKLLATEAIELTERTQTLGQVGRDA